MRVLLRFQRRVDSTLVWLVRSHDEHSDDDRQVLKKLPVAQLIWRTYLFDKGESDFVVFCYQIACCKYPLSGSTYHTFTTNISTALTFSLT